MANGNVTSPRNPFFWPRICGYQAGCFPARTGSCGEGTSCRAQSMLLTIPRGEGERGGESRQRQKEGWLVMMVLRRNPAQRKCLQIGWLTSLLLSAAPGDKRTGHIYYLPPFSAGTG